MFGMLSTEFERLTTAVDFLTADHAKTIIDLISRKLMDQIGAYTIDVLWAEEAEGGTALKPFWSHSNSKSRGPALTHFVTQDSLGIWSKVYRDKIPIWIEDIQSKELKRSTEDGGTESDLRRDYIRLTKPTANKKGTVEIESLDLQFYQDTDTIIAIPLRFKNIVRGVYSIELTRFNRIEEEAYRELVKLADAIASVIWKSEVQSQYLADTNRAILSFRESLQFLPPGVIELSTHRMGFMIRPFEGEEFGHIESHLKRALKKNHTYAEHYAGQPGSGLVINNIMKEIRLSHFGIADITGNRHNVMLELGMMMILDKALLILKQKDDVVDVPFDIGAYDYYRYEMKGPDCIFYDASNRSIPVDQAIDSFVKRLEQENRLFREAKPYVSD